MDDSLFVTALGVNDTDGRSDAAHKRCIALTAALIHEYILAFVVEYSIIVKNKEINHQDKPEPENKKQENRRLNLNFHSHSTLSVHFS